MRKFQPNPDAERPSQPEIDAKTLAQAEEIADYLADVVQQLARLAATAQLDRVGYLLTLAAQEADSSRPRRLRR